MKKPAVPLVAVAVVWGVCIASNVQAGEPRTHDGFFLRLSGGGGAAHSSITAPGLAERISSNGSGDVNFAVGGIIKPNLALHGTLWGWFLQDPDVELSLAGYQPVKTSLNGDVDMSAFGGGLTYYFMPVNIYVTGSAGVGQQTVSGGNNLSGETDYGFVLDLGAGKEWWVGKSWGLGFNLGYSHHSIPDKDVSEHWSGDAFALRFSATLN